MFIQVLNFMQRQDPNGDWLACSDSEAPYVLSTLREWLDDGLVQSERIGGYMAFLEALTRYMNYEG